MKIPLQITFHQVDPSAALEARIRELAARLERYSDHITRCHVTVQAPHRHHQQGNLFDIHLDITVPGREIAIRRAHPADPSHEDPYVALRDAFRAARRKLQDYERERFGVPKARAGQARGRLQE